MTINHIEELRLSSPEIRTSVEMASFLFFDLEKSGLRPDRGAEIVEVAVLSRNNTRFYWNRNLSGSSYNSDLPLDELLIELGRGVVVGHNLPFDFWFLSYEAEKIGLQGLNLQFIDTLGLSRKLIENQEDYQLQTLVRALNIHIEGEPHTAITDARAARALFWHLIHAGSIANVGEAGVKRITWTSK
jgi:DNA polymerase III epsilon subunit-like protein